MTGAVVSEKIPRKHQGDPAQRQKDETQLLKDAHILQCTLSVPDAAAPVEVVADLKRRCIDVGMSLRAPDDRKSTKARVNWLLRQVKTDRTEEVFVRLQWPGASEPTQYSVDALRETPEISSEGKEHLVATGFHIFVSRPLGGRFTQLTNFITELEAVVPEYYGRVGSSLAAWQRTAPKIKSERSSGEDVSPEGIAEDAEEFDK
jgi:hypothetical protein